MGVNPYNETVFRAHLAKRGYFRIVDAEPTRISNTAYRSRCRMTRLWIANQILAVRACKNSSRIRSARL